MVLPDQPTGSNRFMYAAGQGSQGNSNNIGYYFLHDNTQNAGQWRTSDVYAGLYGRVHYAIFRGPTSAAVVSAGAARDANHAGWVSVGYSRGNGYSQSAPPSIAALSGFTSSDNYYTGNISGNIGGYNYDHVYSYRMRTQYRLDGAADLSSTVPTGAVIELRG